ncbi:uncharacterized protein LOC108096165 [Drosophila ficusphila]|uniref:uncharacterized protein LOC108096165 n=1 Tax=Drosophila ficusphila TaxID=30025 RepID=UPI0007E74D4C|nr:uncharacterized protein LOC108096165 [Drosophila ficusphila]
MWRLLILLACLLPHCQVQAAFLEECKGVIINKIANENQECSEFVHCDGDNSYYCNGDCREAVECYVKEVTTKPPEPITTIKPIERTTETTPSQNTTSTTKVTASSTETPSEVITSTPSSDVHVICKTSGRNGVYPYPANSNYYYQCIAGYLLLQQCPQNFHFDSAQGQCISKKPNRSSILLL